MQICRNASCDTAMAAISTGRALQMRSFVGTRPVHHEYELVYSLDRSKGRLRRAPGVDPVVSALLRDCPMCSEVTVRSLTGS